jgi:hypothetical protein
MRSSAKSLLVVPLVAILGLFSLFASEGAGDPHPQGKGTSTVTLYVA